MDELPRDLDDTIIREQLTHVANVRDLLQAVVPDLADGFTFDEAELVPPGHFLPDWRQRESDIIWRIPYRGPDGILPVLVVLLLEHQSRTDPRTPFRSLLYTVLYWDREWRDWEELVPPRPPFRLSPVLPVVFHTGPRPWGSYRTLAELIDAPAALRPLVPDWRPLFWDLADHTPEALWNMAGAWVQSLAVLRAAEGEWSEFERVLAETFRQLEALAETQETRWKELVKFILGWAVHHRPPEERDTLLAAGVANQAAGGSQGRSKNMGKTIADALREEGAREGEQRGEQRGLLLGEQRGEQRGLLLGEQRGEQRGLLLGEQRGELRGRQETLQMQLEDRFGSLPVELVQRILATTDVSRLKAALRQVMHLKTLDELQL